MKNYILFLRGINVGGHKKFAKAAQLEILAILGFSNIKVYLHTGNWIFQTSKTKKEIEEAVFGLIFKKYGWEIPILVKNVSEIENILSNCPFSDKNKPKSYYMLLYTSPKEEQITEVKQFKFSGEHYHITPECVYYYSEIGYGKAKMNTNFFEKKLKVTVTARNFNTMMKIKEIAQSL